MSYWWELLEKLPAIEELELYPTGVGESGGGVWEVSTAPAVLPALRRVQIVAPELERAQYAIIGDRRLRGRYHIVSGGSICGEGAPEPVKRFAKV